MEKKSKKERRAVEERTAAARSAAGKKGAASRWGTHGKTVTVRAYEPDAERLKELAPTTAEAIRGLLEANES